MYLFVADTSARTSVLGGTWGSCLANTLSSNYVRDRYQKNALRHRCLLGYLMMSNYVALPPRACHERRVDCRSLGGVRSYWLDGMAKSNSRLRFSSRLTHNAVGKLVDKLE